MRIAHIFADDYSSYNSSHFRASLIMNALREAGHTVTLLPIQMWANNNSAALRRSASHDIVIIQRVLLIETIPLIQSIRNSGVKVLVDFDDSYDRIRPDNAAYEFWGSGVVTVNGEKKELDVHPIEHFKTVLTTCSGFMCPSEELVNDWGGFAKGYYLPNYLDHRSYIPHINEDYPEVSLPVVGWGGSLSHIPSFEESGVKEALVRLHAEGKIKLMIFGDDRVVSKMEIPETKYLPYCRFYEWPNYLSKIDIGIAPLAGEYDARRSRLKVAEYQMMGIPFVATHGSPYDDTIDSTSGLYVNQGEKGILDKKNVHGWYKALDRIVSNIREYKSDAISGVSKAIKKYSFIENSLEIAKVFFFFLS